MSDRPIPASDHLRPKITLCALVFMFHAVLWCVTGYLPFQSNPYNSYALQAQSWLSGRLDVDYCPWLEQAIFQGRYYISFPPLPSLILLPFTAVFGLNTPDHLLSFSFALTGALCAFDMAERAGKKTPESIFWALFLTVGSNLIFVSMLGWVWYMAQSFAFGFTMLALRGATGAKPSGWRRSLFYLACAVGCRPLNLLFFPLLFYILWQNLGRCGLSALIRKWTWLIAPGCVAVFLCTLNYLRFGSIFEFGHNYLPEFLESPLGQFNLAYIPYNLFRCVRLYTGSFRIPRFDGWAFYLVMPLCLSAILGVIRQGRKNSAEIYLSLGVIVLHLLATCAHKTLGGWHFGCRYLADALPVWFWLCLTCRKNRRFAKSDIFLFVLGVTVNLGGTIWFYLQ